MKANLERLGGLHNSQRVLLALTQKGMSREDAYRAVQRNAMEAWQGNAAFLNLLKADREIGTYLSSDEIDSLFDLEYPTKHVDTIFRRVFGAPYRRRRPRDPRGPVPFRPYKPRVGTRCCRYLTLRWWPFHENKKKSQN